MSDTYYDYRDVKVKIAHRLQKMDGWTVYGYHADNSDPMTDYFDPAYWDGIAEKNGFRLVVDKSSEVADRTETRTRRASGMTAETREKIAKLEQMTQERGASAAEEATAKAKIDALKAKEAADTESYTVFYPGHKANPPRCNWHIEKDGIIIDKGTGLLKFARVPDISRESDQKEWQKFNNSTPEEWKTDFINNEVWKWGENERERATATAESRYNRECECYALLEKFNELIARFNNVCGGMVGEGGYTYERRTETKYKKVYKFQPTTSGSFKEGQCFKVLGRFTYGCGGNVYRLTAGGYSGTLTAYRVSLKSNKTLTGSANAANCFGYYAADGDDTTHGRDKEQFNKWIERGAITWGEIVEVMEPYEVEKFIKVDENGDEVKTRAPKKDTTTETTTEATTAAGYTITPDTDTRDGSAIWIVKLSGRVDREQFETIREEMKAAGGYYSRFKKGFLFKFDPTEALNAGSTAEAPTTDETTAGDETPTAVEETATATTEATETDTETTTEETTAEETTAEETIAEETTTEEAPEQPHEEPKAEQATEPTPEPTTSHTAPQDEQKTPYGYSGPTSDQFDERTLDLLYKGAQIITGEGYNKAAYFTTPYKDGVKFVYSVHIYRDEETPAPGNDAKYCGFIANGNYYSDTQEAAAKLADDINAELLRMIPDEATAEANAGTAERIQEEAEASRRHSYERDAERHLIDDSKPELYLYNQGRTISKADLIRYILNPAEVVKEYAAAEAESYKDRILYKYIAYNKTVEALNAIKANPAHRAHTLRRIAEATKGDTAKTYKLVLSYGATVKADADGVRRLCRNGYISSWDIDSKDRGLLRKDERGHAEEITAEVIKQITHGGRVVWAA